MQRERVTTTMADNPEEQAEKPAGEPEQEQPKDPMLGKVLGGCRIDCIIGQGGMGAVYGGTQVSLDRPVAVK
ncbi:hypothetical protein ACFL59_13105, partial [Planctomycetota bacterium]